MAGISHIEYTSYADGASEIVLTMRVGNNCDGCGVEDERLVVHAEIADARCPAKTVAKSLCMDCHEKVRVVKSL